MTGLHCSTPLRLAKAFVLLQPGHWFAIRRSGDGFWALNSLQSHPKVGAKVLLVAALTHSGLSPPAAQYLSATYLALYLQTVKDAG